MNTPNTFRPAGLKRHPVTAHEASLASPTLARLAEQAKYSADCLKSVLPLIPETLHGSVRAGPMDGGQWCLLVQGNAAAAKLRQLGPSLIARVRERGAEVTAIRVKVQTRT